MSTKKTRRERMKNSTAGLLAEINRRRKAQSKEMPAPVVVQGRVVVTEQQFADAVASTVQAQTPILAEVIRLTGVVPEVPPSWEQGTTLLPLVVPAELVCAERAA